MASTDRIQQPQFFSRQVRDARRFYLDLLPDPGKPFAVVCGGREDCAADFVIDRPTFPYLSIEFVSSGRGTLWLDGREYPLALGSVYTYGPNVAHKIVADQVDPFSKYFVDFVGNDAEQLMEQHGLRLGTVQQVTSPLEVQRNLDDLITHGLRNRGAASQLCDALMQYILILIASCASHDTVSLSPAYTTYVRCRDQIEKHYLRLHSLDELARETFVDKAYLCRLFQRFDSQTPHQYLMRLKMNRAAELLEDSEMLVKQVSVAVGFDDAFHFSRVFKNVLGISPKAFRHLRAQGVT